MVGGAQFGFASVSTLSTGPVVCLTWSGASRTMEEQVMGRGSIEVIAERDAIGRAPGVSILGLDLVASKLRRPPIRPGTVRRSLLVEQLEAADSAPIVSVVAPAGFGKTTLLSQWAERNGQSFAWVSVDEADNDHATWP